MAQQNHHYPFNFTIEGQNLFDPQSSHVSGPNSTYQPWRSMGQIPSPSPSQRDSMSASSTAASMNGHGLNRPTAFQLDSSMDPNMHSSSLLAVPQLGRTRSPVDNHGIDPVYTRMYGGIHDEPWSAVRMRNNSAPSGATFFSQSDYTTFREGPASDIDSVAPRSDSGYYTQQAHSINNEPERPGQELPEMAYSVRNVTVTSSPSEPTEVYPLPSDQTSQYSGRSVSTGKQNFKCTQCKEVSKCPSDFKKHKLKHDKPYVCNIQGCRRAAIGKGFTTKNDLDRHKKSVHRVGVEKGSYQCASEHCRNKGKIWPRLDNFKQHINRMHKDEDEHDLINRSSYHEPSTPNGECLRVAPLDTALAGIGTDKQFAGNDLDDPASGISLTPDQDSSRWDTFNHTAHVFALDADQSNDGPNDASSIKVDGETGLEPPHQTHVSNSYSAKGTRIRQDSLQVLADAADIEASRPRLSRAPQTKAEQQKQALRKFSRTIAERIKDEASVENADLENVVLKVLYDAANQSPKESIKGDAKNISNFIKQGRQPQVDSTSRRPSKALSPNKIQCEQCVVTVSRSCDMRKHMKRHTKPYGCTYPKCFKRFGAKSDWKRHENNQHYQQEVFLCHYPSTAPCLTPSTEPFTPCNQLCYRHEQFKAHLQKEHKITDVQQLKKDLKERKIGMGNQRQFWCGFCKNIVPLKEKRNAAWDERFDHIDEHFSKQHKSIEDWICLEAGRPKGELKRELDRRKSQAEDDIDDDDEEGVAADGVADDTPSQVFPPFDPSDESVLMTSPFPTTTAPPTSVFYDSSSFLAPSRKRPMSQMEDTAPSPVQKRRKGELSRYCCSCKSGPWAPHSFVACMECDHRLCGGCTVVDSWGL